LLLALYSAPRGFSLGTPVFPSPECTATFEPVLWAPWCSVGKQITLQSHTRPSKMELSCPLGTTRRVPQEKLRWKPYNKSFLDQACSVKMAGYWPRSSLRVYGPRLRLGP